MYCIVPSWDKMSMKPCITLGPLLLSLISITWSLNHDNQSVYKPSVELLALFLYIQSFVHPLFHNLFHTVDTRPDIRQTSSNR